MADGQRHAPLHPRRLVRAPMARARVLAEARRWIGTPWHHRAALPGVGCDCYGQLRGMWDALIGAHLPPGAPQARLPLPPYRPGWADTRAGEQLLGVMHDHFVAQPPATRAPGTVLVFRMRADAPARHCAVRIDEASMIHCTEALGVHAAALSRAWTRRAVGAFAFPQLRRG